MVEEILTENSQAEPPGKDNMSPFHQEYFSWQGAGFAQASTPEKEPGGVGVEALGFGSLKIQSDGKPEWPAGADKDFDGKIGVNKFGDAYKEGGNGLIKEFSYSDGTKLTGMKYNEKKELSEFVGPDKQTYKYVSPKPASPFESERSGGWKSPEMRQPMDLGKLSVNQLGLQKDGGLNSLPFKLPQRPRR